MEIIFGLSFDEKPLPGLTGNSGGCQYLGPIGLLYFLESRLGLIGLPANNEYLRIEQYRQALRLLLEKEGNTFYQQSFEVDQLATAAALLQRRDELLLAGWDFKALGKERLDCLAQLELYIKEEAIKLAPGFADRFTEALKHISSRNVSIDTIYIHEPERLLPAHYLRLFNLLEKRGATVEYIAEPEISGDSDLTAFQKAISGAGKQTLKGDGSLLILKGSRASSLASFFAKLLKHTPSLQPALLIPEKNNTLDHAFTMEGIPSLGTLSASLARPTLQVLKLITVFLWEPIDPFKIMEFVSLAVKPLDRELSNRIAGQMAQAPGLDSDSWRTMIARFFSELEERAANDNATDISKIRDQYNRWFRRQRFHISESAPKTEVIEIFRYLAQWAFDFFEEEGSKNNSLLVLSEQAKRVGELLEELPETRLYHLELERIVRTIYEPAPIQFRDQQFNHYPYTLHPGAIHGTVEQLAWWNFIQAEPQHFFSRWYQSERHALKELKIQLETPEDENARLIWHRKRPVRHCQKQLLLLIPQQIKGQVASAHPLLGDLEATFGDLSEITLNINSIDSSPSIFKQHFTLPSEVALPQRQLGTPKPFLEVQGLQQLEERSQESFSSLNDLFYYPYQWIFRHKLKLRKSSILSVVQEKTLMGNLAHRFFEKLLNEPALNNWRQADVEAFIEQEKNELFRKEGAVMLMYGKEPERISFIQRLKFSAWNLVRHIRENGWQVAATELPLSGKFENIKVNARADLVLQRGSESVILDLKWRGANFRKQMIKNEEDLQLILYSKLQDKAHAWSHVAYYIIENGLMLARNQEAFKDIDPVSPDADMIEVHQRILDRMKATYQWRKKQIQEGKVEIRCTNTEQLLEEAYEEDDLFNLLEMKSGDAPFDDYRVLINLLQ